MEKSRPAVLRDRPSPIPTSHQHGAARFAALPESLRAPLSEFSRALWNQFTQDVYDASDPAHVGAPREVEAHVRLRRQLSWLSDGCFGAMWNTAFRYAMM